MSCNALAPWTYERDQSTHKQSGPDIIEFGFLDLECLLEGLFAVLRWNEVFAVRRRGLRAIFWLLLLIRLLGRLVRLRITLRRPIGRRILLIALLLLLLLIRSFIDVLIAVIICCLTLMRHDDDAPRLSRAQVDARVNASNNVDQVKARRYTAQSRNQKLLPVGWKSE